MMGLNNVRAAIKAVATASLSEADAEAVVVVVDLASDSDLTALTEFQQINVGTDEKPRLKLMEMTLLKPKLGIYQTAAAARVLLEQARAEGLTSE